MTNDRAIHLLESMAVDHPQERYQEAINLAIEALKAPTGLISKQDVKWQIQEWITELNEALDMLDSIPSAEPKTNMKSWDGLYIKVYADDDPQDKAEKMYQICGDIAELSKVTEFLKEYCDTPSAEPKTGEWVEAVKDGVLSYTDVYAMCDQCHKVKFNGWGMNYCPNCGARMIREDGEA